MPWITCAEHGRQEIDTDDDTCPRCIDPDAEEDEEIDEFDEEDDDEDEDEED